jgi:hypothetical protein
MRSNRPLGTGYKRKYEDISSRYDWNIASGPNMTYSSFEISRPLQGKEQLDFSHGPDQKHCQVFLRSYWPHNSPSKGMQKDNSSRTNIKQRDVLIWKIFNVFEFGLTRN